MLQLHYGNSQNSKVGRVLKCYYYTMKISKIFKLGKVKMLPLHNGNSNKLRWERVKMLPLHYGNSQNFRVGMGLKCYHYTVKIQQI